tara:strand:- start:1890 stop:2132 length:243 start_codon:yes stop_codon:yes gene_type:complete
MDPNKENNKSWKKAGYFSTYEEAQTKKTQLHAEHTVDNELVVKIRRSGPGGTRFTVKYWHPDFVKPKNKKKNKRPDSSAG